MNILINKMKKPTLPSLDFHYIDEYTKEAKENNAKFT
jgi:hypothetical protein